MVLVPLLGLQKVPVKVPRLLANTLAVRSRIVHLLLEWMRLDYLLVVMLGPCLIHLMLHLCCRIIVHHLGSVHGWSLHKCLLVIVGNVRFIMHRPHLLLAHIILTGMLIEHGLQRLLSIILRCNIGLLSRHMVMILLHLVLRPLHVGLLLLLHVNGRRCLFSWHLP